MLRAAHEEGVVLARQLTEAIFNSGEIPAAWEESFLRNLYTGEDEAHDHSNHHGHKLKDHIMKLLEWMLDFYILTTVDTDKMQFSFVPGRCTTDAIFIVLKMLRKYMDTNKPLHFALL